MYRHYRIHHILIAFLISVGFFLFFNVGTLMAANINFTSDTAVNLSGVTQGTLFIASGSEADTVTVDGSDLDISGIPSGSGYFNLKTSEHDNTLKLDPSGDSLSLDFNTANYSDASKLITQWTLDSPSSGTTVSIVLGVAEADEAYEVKVDDVTYDTFVSDENREISFEYDEGFSTSKTFSVEEGELLPGLTEGTLTSATIDTENVDGVTLTGFVWQGTQPAGTSVTFQVAVSNDSDGPWDFFGPDGASSQWYGRACPRPGTGNAGPGVPICVDKDLTHGYRYLRYKVRLKTDEDGTTTPTVEDIVTIWADR